MKLRSETRQLLAALAEEEFPVTATEFARRLGMEPNTLRRRLQRLVVEGYAQSQPLEFEWVGRAGHHNGRGPKRQIAAHFSVTAAGRAAAQQAAPRKLSAPRPVNSVFELGSR